MDPERIVSAQNGDLIAMGELLDELAPWVGRLCGSIALDAGPDAAQEALIQVMRDLGGLRDPTSLRGWVRRIALREAIRHAERRRREPLFEDADQFAGTKASAAERGLRTANDSARAAPRLDPGLCHDVVTVLTDLRPDQRAILILRDLEGLSEAEAAAVLDLTPGTIKSRLHRAREAFRKRWSE